MGNNSQKDLMIDVENTHHIKAGVLQRKMINFHQKLTLVILINFLKLNWQYI